MTHIVDRYQEFLAFRLVRFRMLWRIKHPDDPDSPISDYIDTEASESFEDCVRRMRHTERSAIDYWYKWMIVVPEQFNGPDA